MQKLIYHSEDSTVEHVQHEVAGQLLGLEHVVDEQMNTVSSQAVLPADNGGAPASAQRTYATVDNILNTLPPSIRNKMHAFHAPTSAQEHNHGAPFALQRWYEEDMSAAMPAALINGVLTIELERKNKCTASSAVNANSANQELIMDNVACDEMVLVCLDTNAVTGHPNGKASPRPKTIVDESSESSWMLVGRAGGRQADSGV